VAFEDAARVKHRFESARREALRSGAWALLALLAACATERAPAAPPVPAALAVPASQALAQLWTASGVQIYTCMRSAADPARYEWQFKAPEATLFDAQGHRRARHYDGPTWEAEDGSKVVGAVQARDAGPDANAIPWLLLSAASTSGRGLLSGTLSIQRITTAGGRAPAAGCGPEQQGEVLRVPYTAEYAFYKLRR
jgi:hypothetical protein